jgi:hypothetical protein
VFLNTNISKAPPPIDIDLMSSSPTKSNHDPSRWNDSNDSSPEPSMCDCQSQLKHYDTNGDPREDLPDWCKRSMGIPVENVPISKGNRELNHLIGTLRIDTYIDGMLTSVEDASATESDSEWDLKWDHCKTIRFESTKLTVLQ